MKSEEQVTSFLSLFSEPKEVTESDVQNFIEFISETEGKSQQSVFQVIGDLCREEVNRKVFGKNDDIYEIMIKNLSVEEMETEQLVLRAVGNISYQNEEHRNRFVKLGISELLANKLKKYAPYVEDENFQSILRNLAGCVANMTFVIDEEAEKLEKGGALDAFYHLLNHSNNPVVLMMIFRALCNLSENDSIKEKVGQIGEKNNFMKLMVEKFSSKFEDSVSDVFSLLSTLFENNQSNCESFVLSGGLDIICNFINQNGFENNNNNGADIEDEDEKEEAEEHQKQVNDAFSLLLTIAAVEKLSNECHERVVKWGTKLKELKFENPLLDKLIRFFAVVAAANEETMRHLYTSLITESSILCDFLRDGPKEIKISSAFLLANLCRIDEICTKIANEKAVISELMSLLKNETENPQVQHIVLGALRNLAIPTENKSILFDYGILQAIGNTISNANNAHVLFNSVLTLKIMLNGKIESIADEFKNEVLQVVIDLFKRDLFEEQMRILFEADRLLLNFANTGEKYRDTLIKAGGGSCLQLLLTSPHKILLVEILDFLLQVTDHDLQSHLYSGKMVDSLKAAKDFQDDEVATKATTVLNLLSEEVKSRTAPPEPTEETAVSAEGNTALGE